MEKQWLHLCLVYEPAMMKYYLKLTLVLTWIGSYQTVLVQKPDVVIHPAFSQFVSYMTAFNIILHFNIILRTSCLAARFSNWTRALTCLFILSYVPSFVRVACPLSCNNLHLCFVSVLPEEEQKVTPNRQKFCFVHTFYSSKRRELKNSIKTLTFAQWPCS